MIETISWEEFLLDKLFEIKAGKYHSSDEYKNGDTSYVSASATNNAISERINLEYDFEGNVIITGKVGCTAFYQKENFCATSDVNIIDDKLLYSENGYIPGWRFMEKYIENLEKKEKDNIKNLIEI